MPPFDTYTQQHLARLEAYLKPDSTAQSAAKWIVEHTYLRGKPFSFQHHEYQQTLLADTARIKYVRKCSQVGISELSVRRIVAICNLLAGVNAIYVLPTALFASTFSASRLNPVIDNSPTAKTNLHPATDSSMLKRFLNDSFIFMRGASRSGQAISVPCDFLVIDEEDFAEDMDILTSFSSRLTHSDYKDEAHFSTPTHPGHGISYGYTNSIRHIELQQCCHCNHWFAPDYYKHVKLPGYNAARSNQGPAARSTPAAKLGTVPSLLDINFFTKNTLADQANNLDVTTAYLECPKCYRPVNQDIRYRQFVQENPEDRFEAHGYQITPFCAPKQVPPSEIIRISTRYKATKDFVNNCLGLPYEDSDSGLSLQEAQALFYSDVSFPDHPAYQVAGNDLGGSCAMLTGSSLADGHLRIYSAELIPLHRMKERYPQVLAQQRVIAACSDAMPYTDLVSYLQDTCPNLWAAIYTRSKGLELFQVKEQEEDEEKATFGLRQINVKRNAAFDFVLGMIRAKKISFHLGSPSIQNNMDTIISHLVDMRRTKIKNSDGEEEYVWQKSPAGADHFMHALLYLIIANFVKGTIGHSAGAPFLVSKFKTKGGL